MELQHSTSNLEYFLFLCEISIPRQSFSGLPDLNLQRTTVSKNNALPQLHYISKFWKFELNLLQSEVVISCTEVVKRVVFHASIIQPFGYGVVGSSNRFLPKPTARWRSGT